MDKNQLSDELLQFFKALADSNRLKIVGLLSRQSCTVEQLSALLGLSMSTTSHHLARLSQAGLVEARTDGHYFHYTLCTDVLQDMAQRLLQAETLPSLSTSVDLEAYDRKVLKTFTDSEGRIIAFPSQLKKYQVLLRYVVNVFEPGKRYSEKQVNEMLSRYHEDTADLRRGLVEFKLMARVGGGGEYWRLVE